MAGTRNERIAELMDSIRYVDFHNAMKNNNFQKLNITDEDYYDLLDEFSTSMGAKISQSEKQLQSMYNSIIFLNTSKYLYSINEGDEETSKLLSLHGIEHNDDEDLVIKSIEEKIEKLSAKYKLLNSEIVRVKSNNPKSGHEAIAQLALSIEGYLPATISISEYIGYYKVALQKAKSLKN